MASEILSRWEILGTQDPRCPCLAQRLECQIRSPLPQQVRCQALLAEGPGGTEEEGAAGAQGASPRHSPGTDSIQLTDPSLRTSGRPAPPHTRSPDL